MPLQRMAWYSLAIGAVVGSEHKGETPEGVSGAKSTNPQGSSSKSEDTNGGQGMFSLGGHEIWLYVGGIVGWGETVGPYFTTGPMIGSDMDWAVGGGIHFGQRFGLGVVLPVRATLQHSDKAVGMIDAASTYALHAHNAITQLAQASDLERAVSNPCCFQQ
jgi:hypothetical protein